MENVGLKERAYNRALKKIFSSFDSPKTTSLKINPSKSYLILFEGTENGDRHKIQKFSQYLKGFGKSVKLLSYIDSKGELMDFGMAVYNNKSVNWFEFPKKHILQLLESESFDVLFNLNIQDKKHLHALACKANAAFKLSLPTKYPHNFTLILETIEKENLDEIIQEINSCLNKISDN